MSERLSQQEAHEFLLLTQKFTRQTVQPAMSAEFSDGDLSKIPKILEQADETGLLASSENTYGIWGKDLDENPELSLQMLAHLAESCAGTAACFHFRGLAENAAALLNTEIRNGVLALQESFGLPFAGHLKNLQAENPIKWETRLTQEDGKWILNGGKQFVYLLPGTEEFFILAQKEEQWIWLKIPLQTPGILRTAAEPRSGLRACKVEHFQFDHIPLHDDNILAAVNATEILQIILIKNWLGLSAIALGTARGALNSAKTYTQQRYQGGSLIKEHDAVRGLLAGAEANIQTIEALLNSRAQISKETLKEVRKAAMCKWQAMELSSGAVTDALQTMGGYGYMEDYGMEKRLRDTTVLKSMAGSPLYLKRLISELDEDL